MIHKPTAEQTAIVDAARTGAHLVVGAGAGTGKTSTAKLLARAKPYQAGAYLAYNKSTATDAEAAFPSTVAVGTTHKFAYRAIGYRYAHRLKGPRMKASDIARQLGINSPLHLGTDVPKLAPAQVARIVTATVKRFTYSADRHITRRHMPNFAGFEEPAARAALAQAIGPYARTAWLDIADEQGRLPFDGDCYLKLWQLSNPILRYDYILLDEAQDSNAAVADVVMRQPNAQRILVGDRCQAINGWRGAVDAMETFEGERFFLTQSFRFGQAVADEANKWLSLLASDMRLTGFDKIASRVEPCPNPLAILCRSNGATLVAAINAMEAGQKVAIVGGGGSLASYAKAAIQLKAGQPCEHPELVTFANWREVQEYCEFDANDDLRTMVRLIDKYEPEEIIKIADALTDEASADLIVSTAHKSKGREWPMVKVADDFHEPRPDPITGETRLSRADAMLAYVTVTRAKDVLDRGSLAWVDSWVDTPATRYGEPVDLPPALPAAPPAPRHEGVCLGICDDSFPRRCLWKAPEPVGAMA